MTDGGGSSILIFASDPGETNLPSAR